MRLNVYKTHAIKPGDSLFDLIDRYVPYLEERTILAVTSKIISLCEGRVIPRDQVLSKKALIQAEADAYLENHDNTGIELTIKNHILIPSAGIDESNGNGFYILYPLDIQQSALNIWEYLRQKTGVKDFGILVTDSHTTPTRRGVVGLGLGWCGFHPLYNYIGKPDCFGVPLKVTMVNVLDALAAAAVFCMGEGNEHTPFCSIHQPPQVEFQDRPPLASEVAEISIPLEEDLYAPLLKGAPWVKNSPYAS